MNNSSIVFIGGGNMAGAIIGGLRRQGLAAAAIHVVEPYEAARAKLLADHGVRAIAQPDASLQAGGVAVWAVKPQTFAEAAAAARPFVGQALHLSVAAGIRSEAIARWLGSERVVRAMPNTPALVGQGMTALFARSGVQTGERAQVDSILAPTGDCLWLNDEAQLDAVTALSGSGPAYVFYFLEAMSEAGVQMGLDAAQAKRLAIGTFRGAAHLAADSPEEPEVLRQRVTSKGGTTHAAISSMEADGVKALFVKAMRAAQARAIEMGDEFGK